MILNVRENSVARLHQMSADADKLADDLHTLEQQLESRSFDPAAKVRMYLKQRRYREAMFKPGTFADPAWDIMLDLYASMLEGRRVSVSDACLASCVPFSTALRYIAKLVEDGIILRTNAESDGRRVYLTLEASARSALGNWVSGALG